MEKKIPYSQLNDIAIEQVKNGERLILTSKAGEAAAALVPLEDLELIKDYEQTQEEIDSSAVEEAKRDKNLVDWEDYNKNN